MLILLTVRPVKQVRHTVRDLTLTAEQNVLDPHLPNDLVALGLTPAATWTTTTRTITGETMHPSPNNRAHRRLRSPKSRHLPQRPLRRRTAASSR